VSGHCDPIHQFEHFYGFIGGENSQHHPALYDGTTPIEPERIARGGLTDDARRREWRATAGASLTMRRDVPILEHDPAREAIIEPKPVVKAGVVPPRCVLCFFHEVFTRLDAAGELLLVSHLTSTMGSHPVYVWGTGPDAITLVHPGLGSPLAAVILEELIALGCRAFVACGGAGVLDKLVVAGQLVVPTAAVRDEGTSYHYLPAAREVTANADAVKAISDTLAGAGVSFRAAKTWTTDAVYRETANKIAMRLAEGCVTVEMEAAALFAVAQFRDVPLGVILYGGDDVSGLTWDRREGFDRTEARRALVHLAAAACRAIPLRRDTRLQAAVVRGNELLLVEMLIDDGRRFWLLPGGGREPGDSDDARAVAREVREETGLEVTLDRLLSETDAHPDDTTYGRYRTFLCRSPNSAAPSAGSRDGIATIGQIRWIRLDDETSWGPAIVEDRFLYPQLRAIAQLLQ
jgi:uridine phosphorylase/8-oxo-dGTP pyrophosphatase MutT (NUDIX family)